MGIIEEQIKVKKTQKRLLGDSPLRLLFQLTINYLFNTNLAKYSISLL